MANKEQRYLVWGKIKMTERLTHSYLAQLPRIQIIIDLSQAPQLKLIVLATRHKNPRVTQLRKRVMPRFLARSRKLKQAVWEVSLNKQRNSFLTWIILKVVLTIRSTGKELLSHQWPQSKKITHGLTSAVSKNQD